MAPHLSRLFSNQRALWLAVGGAGLLGAGMLYLAAGGAGSSDSFANTAVQMMLKTTFVLGLACLMLNWLKRWHSGQPRTRQLAIVETLRLSPRQAVYLVRMGDRFVLVGATDSHISLLTEAESPAAASFAAYFAQLGEANSEVKQ